MSAIDTVIVVDWSARSKPSPKAPTKDSIFWAEHQDGLAAQHYCTTRARACAMLVDRLEGLVAEGRRVLVGFDFPFGYPRGFAEAVTGKREVFALWDWLSEAITDDDRNANNRFDVAEALNRKFPGIGPFWGCPANRASADLPMRGRARSFKGLPERRGVEEHLKRAQPCWKLFTTGSVGSQALLGIPRINALRRHFGDRLAVRPFETRAAPILLAEIYPSLLDAEVKARQRGGEIFDAAQVRVLAAAFAGLEPALLEQLLTEGDPEEGWIAGLGHEAALRAALGPLD